VAERLNVLPVRHKTPAAHDALFLAFILGEAKIYNGGLLYLSLTIFGTMGYVEIQFRILFIGDRARKVSG
jgi:hypothetical protein